jgi:prevent-host-death family protein
MIRDTTIDVHAAKARLSRLIKAAAAGEEIIIAKAGKPLARLVPFAQPEKRRRNPGRLAGRAVIPLEFDEPLPDEVLDAFEHR